MDNQTLLDALTSDAEENLNRHLNTTKNWWPHQLIPWDKGTNYPQNYQWAPEEHPLNKGTRSALYVNLLTEDNLPYYFRDIDRLYGHAGGAWGEWTRRWTAEEGRHAIVIRDYLHVTRAIDPVELENGRMAQITAGQTPTPKTAAHGLAYVTLQELATRITHRNTGKQLQDPDGYNIMAKIAGDENLHYLFYRNMADAALKAAPNLMMQAIADEVCNFKMPGYGIPNFNQHAKNIAKAGIYDLHIHYEQILQPVILHHWNITQLEGLDEHGEKARDKTLKHLDRLKTAANRQKRHKEENAAPLQT